MTIQPDSILTVLATRVVRAGCEKPFEAALHDFIQRSTQTEGQFGVQVVRPSPGSGSRVYAILRRFASEKARDEFQASELLREWSRTVAPLTEGELNLEEMSGLEAWFTLPGEPIKTPPRWKTALMTLLGVYPISQLFSWALAAALPGWPGWLRGLVMSVMMVACLTWLVMPRLAHLFHGWLYGGIQNR